MLPQGGQYLQYDALKGGICGNCFLKILFNVHFPVVQIIIELQINTAVFMDFNLSPSPETAFALLF